MFYNAGSMQWWGKYLEVAPKTWSGAAEDPLLVYCNPRRSTGMSGRSVGDGKQNTADGAGCNAPDTVMAYRGGGQSDWYIPAEQELYRLRDWQQAVTPFQGGFNSSPWPNYFTSSRWNANNVYFTYLSSDTRTNLTWDQLNSMYVRPIRAIGLLEQTITWSPTLTVSVGDSPYTPTALATTSGTGSITYSLVSAGTTGCSVNLSTAIITFTGTGTCVIRATASNTSTHSVARKDLSFVITLPPQTVTWSPTTTLSAAASPVAPSSLATSNGSGRITYSVVSAGTTGCSVDQLTGVLTYSAIGTCTVRATAAATAQNSAGTRDVAFIIGKSDQTVTWNPSTSLLTTASPATPSSLATSSGPGSVSYSVISSGTTGCSINSSSGVLSFSSAGTCTVRATAAATTTHDPGSKDVEFTISSPPAPVENQSGSGSGVQSDATAQTGRPATTDSNSTKRTTTTAASGTSGTTAGTTTSSISPTTTTTTVALAPEAPEIEPGAGGAIIDGEVVSASVTRRDNALNLSMAGLEALVWGVSQDGGKIALDSDGNLNLVEGDSVQFEASGFESNAEIDVWVYSSPVRLATMKTSPTGAIAGVFPLPAAVGEGKHRLVFDGRTSSGDPVTMAVGLQVGSFESDGVSPWVFIIPISLAIIIALVIPTRARRRKKSLQIV